MPVKTADKRIAKWIAKMQGDAVSVVTARQIEKMSEYIQTAFVDIEKLENETKAILDEAAVPTIQNPTYLNFAREVGRSCRKFGGGQLIGNVDVILNKYVGMGLDRDILERIRDTVFALGAPAP